MSKFGPYDLVVVEGFVLWLTGLSQAGKTTVAMRIEEILRAGGSKIERLDGDVVRESLSQDLGYSKVDRDTNIERITFVAELLSRNNVGVLTSFISPYRAQRARVRARVTNFIEVFVNAPIWVCEARDTNGLYAKARRGEIDNFTGISDPYEVPEEPEIEIRTDIQSVDECAQYIVDYLLEYGHIKNKLESVSARAIG